MCDVTMAVLNQFLGGQSATVVELRNTTELTMVMDIYSVSKTTGEYVAAFGCASRDCRKEREEGGNSTRVRCMATTCEMYCEVGKNTWCFEGLRGIVTGIGKKGPLDVVCEEDGRTCRVDEGECSVLYPSSGGLRWLRRRGGDGPGGSCFGGPCDLQMSSRPPSTRA